MKFDRIKDLRTDRDLMQKEIAYIIGVDQAHYSRYESGFYPIPVDKLILLADFYNVSLDYIVGRTNEPTINYGTRPRPKSNTN